MTKEEKYKDREMGIRIKKAREAKGLTIKRMAGFAQISSATFSQIEAGSANISDSQLEKIASFLGSTKDYLLTGEYNTGAKAEAPASEPADNSQTEDTLPAEQMSKIESSADLDLYAAITLPDDMREDLDYIAQAQGSSIDEIMKEFTSYMLDAGREWIEMSMIPLKAKMIQEKTSDVAAILEGLSPEDIQKVLANLSNK